MAISSLLAKIGTSDSIDIFKDMKRVSWIRLILLASLIIVSILSLVSASSIPNFAAFEYLTDKLIHGIIYFYLAPSSPPP